MAPPSRSTLVPERLSGGLSASVLVVDFQPFASGRRLGELLAADPDQRDLSVFQLEPARDLADSGHRPLDDLAAGYAQALLAEDRAPVSTVLGYCSGALLALRIAERLAGHRPVGVLLLRPSWPEAETIAGMLGRIRSELTGSPGPAPELDGEPAAVLAGIERVLQADLRALAETHGLDPDAGPLAELLRRYRGWFGYLLAVRDALRAGRPPRPAPQLLLDLDEDAGVPFADAAGYRTERLRLPAEDAQATEQLARAVTRHLRRPG